MYTRTWMSLLTSIFCLLSSQSVMGQALISGSVQEKNGTEIEDLIITVIAPDRTRLTAKTSVTKRPDSGIDYDAEFDSVDVFEGPVSIIFEARKMWPVVQSRLLGESAAQPKEQQQIHVVMRPMSEVLKLRAFDQIESAINIEPIENTPITPNVDTVYEQLLSLEQIHFLLGDRDDISNDDHEDGMYERIRRAVMAIKMPKRNSERSSLSSLLEDKLRSVRQLYNITETAPLCCCGPKRWRLFRRRQR